MISKSKVLRIYLGTNDYDLRTHKFKNAEDISDGKLTLATDTDKLLTA